ncbi:hypothetical protein IH879_19330 [candidate division KSB1 bacterium]|nr:hypothetical protein [candidate division KSB1 bacterium]
MTSQIDTVRAKDATYAQLLIRTSMLFTGICGVVFECVLAGAATRLFGNSDVEWAKTLTFLFFGMGLATWGQRYYLRKTELSQAKFMNLIRAFITIEITLAVAGSIAVQVLFVGNAYIPEEIYLIRFLFTFGIGLLIGAEIPLAQRVNEYYAQLAENIADTNAWDYIGSGIGGWLFYSVLLYAFRFEQIGYVAGALNFVVAGMTFWFFKRQKMVERPLKLQLVFAIVTIILIGGYAAAPHLVYSLQQKFYTDPIVYIENTGKQIVAVTKNARSGHATLIYDTYFQQASQLNKGRYTDRMALYPTLLCNLYHQSIGVPEYKLDVAIFGGGDGLVANVLTKVSFVNSITLVEYDPAVIRICSTQRDMLAWNDSVYHRAKNLHVLKSGVLFPGEPLPHVAELGRPGEFGYDSLQIALLPEQRVDYHGTDEQFRNPELIVVNHDANLFARDIKQKYDVIIMDYPDPRTLPLSILYTVESFHRVRRVLKKGGVIITQATSPLHSKDVFLCINNTMKAVGFKTIPLKAEVPSFTGGHWGWIIGHFYADDLIAGLLEKFDKLEQFPVATEYLQPANFQHDRYFTRQDLTADKYEGAVNTFSGLEIFEINEDKDVSWSILN